MTESFESSRAAEAVRELLLACGLDPDSEQLAKTPGRVAETFAEFFSGLHEDPKALFANLMPLDGAPGEMVLVKDMRFRSVCEHHLLPFHGIAHIAYLPDENVVGLSALPRLVNTVASRPQVQERIGEEVADLLDRYLGPRGSLVVLQARHGCLADRGVSQDESSVLTIASRGDLSDPVRRQETMSILFGTPSINSANALTVHSDEEAAGS